MKLINIFLINEKTLYITGSPPKKSLNLGESIDVLVINLENNIGLS